MKYNETPFGTKIVGLDDAIKAAVSDMMSWDELADRVLELEEKLAASNDKIQKLESEREELMKYYENMNAENMNLIEELGVKLKNEQDSVNEFSLYSQKLELRFKGLEELYIDSCAESNKLLSEIKDLRTELERCREMYKRDCGGE